MNIQKFEYLENKKSFLDEINIFHSFILSNHDSWFINSTPVLFTASASPAIATTVFIYVFIYFYIYLMLVH